MGEVLPPLRKVSDALFGQETKETGLAEAAEVGVASRSIRSEARRWMNGGLGWETDLVFKELARRLGDRLECRLEGKQASTGSWNPGRGVEGLRGPHSKWKVREAKSNCKPARLGVYRS